MKNLSLYIVTFLLVFLLTMGCTLQEINSSLISSTPKESTLQVSSSDGKFTGYVNGVALDCAMVDGMLLYQGDIIADEFPPSTETRGCGNVSGLWSNAIIPYTVDSNFVNTTALDRAIENYQLIGIYWVPRQNQKDYVHFQNHGSKNFSNVGRQGSRQYINIHDYYVGTIMHEMGHTLGLYHEQSRLDRDSFINLHTENMNNPNDINYALSDGNDDFMFYNFDWKSIMLYSSIASAISGIPKDPSKPVYTMKDGTIVTAQRTGLSAGDIGTLHIMYPKTSSPVNTTPVSRQDGTIDIFFSDQNGRIKTTAWHKIAGGWKKPWNVKTAYTELGGHIAAVARSSNNLDLFTIDKNTHRVISAAWNPNNSWNGWWTVGNQIVNHRLNKVAAVSRALNNLDIFVIDNSGYIKSAAWESGVSNGNWRGWWRIGDAIALAGTNVEAISVASDQLDLFIINEEGTIQTNRWKANSGWTGWIGLGRPGDATNLTAVSSGGGRIHLFAVCIDGSVHSAHMPGYRNPATSWRRIGSLTAAPGVKVAAVSRKVGLVDIFVKDNNSRIQSASWQNGFDSANFYRGWWQVDSGCWWGTDISVVSMNENHLSVFHSKVDQDIRQASWTPSTGWVTGVAIP